MHTIYGVCDVLVKHQPPKSLKTNVLEYKYVAHAQPPQMRIITPLTLLRDHCELSFSLL